MANMGSHFGQGASVHGLPALWQMPGNKWLEVTMIRMDHNGAGMWTPSFMNARAGECAGGGEACG